MLQTVLLHLATSNLAFSMHGVHISPSMPNARFLARSVVSEVIPFNFSIFNPLYHFSCLKVAAEQKDQNLHHVHGNELCSICIWLGLISM